jgi:hypothetical protein
VYPGDAFGAQFTSNGLVSGYNLLRSELIPNDPTTYKQYHSEILTWLSDQNGFFAAVRQPQTASAWSNPVYDQEIYSVGQWLMVKSWEINQEYGLEGMPQAAFGPQAEDRAWYSNQAFFTSPFMLKIPRPSPGIGNGSLTAFDYDSFAWYHTQLILNDGNGTASGTWPIDRGYALAYLYNNLTWDSSISRPRVGTAGLMMEWLAKILQSGDLNDVNPYFMTIYPGQWSTWSELPPSQKTQLMTAWTSTFLSTLQSLTPAKVLTEASGATSIYNSAVGQSFTGDLSWALPELRYFGVSPTVLTGLANWASGLWPAFNWLGTLNESCVVNSSDNAVSCN